MKTKNRKKLLIENIFIFGFGGVISKAIPIIMVPIVTRMISNSAAYGISDLTTTIVSLFSAFALCGMYDAMFRMFFEKKEELYQKKVCSSAFAFTIISAVAVGLIMVLLRQQIATLFYTDSQYAYLIYLAALTVLVGTTNSIVSAPTRMQNKRITYLAMNTISPIISYSIAILLLHFKFYLLALPVGALLSAFTCEAIFLIINHKWFSFKSIDFKLIKDMALIGLPLMPNFIIYWIFNSSDKIMISNFLGNSSAGVYAVGAKLGHVSQLINTAFAGGWQFFVFSTMRDKDHKKVISLVFEFLLVISITTTIIVTAFVRPIVTILFEEEYKLALYLVPYLFLSPLLNMLFNIGSDQFIVIKKTWPNLLILLSGALINVALNFCLIRTIGLEGAGIATFIGYFVSLVILIIVLQKMNLLQFRLKTFVSVSIFLIFFLMMRANDYSSILTNLVLMAIFLVIIYVLYFNDYKPYCLNLMKGLRKNAEK